MCTAYQLPDMIQTLNLLHRVCVLGFICLMTPGLSKGIQCHLLYDHTLLCGLHMTLNVLTRPGVTKQHKLKLFSVFVKWAVSLVIADDHLNPQADSLLFAAVLLLLQTIINRGGRPGLPDWGFKTSWGVCLGMDGLTYSLYHHDAFLYRI